MPSRAVAYTGSAFALSIAIYIALVITTVYLASIETDIAGSVRDREAAIGALESQYYSAVAVLSAADPATYGLVSPTHITYARAETAPTLTRAGY